MSESIEQESATWSQEPAEELAPWGRTLPTTSAMTSLIRAPGHTSPSSRRSDCMSVLRQPATVVSDGSALFTKDSTAIRAVLRVGFCWTYPLTVVKISKT